MATQLQMRSGTTLQNDIFTGAPGEITYDTEKKNLRIHDGETVGGMEIASAGAADYVVEWQTPTEANGYTWYRKYKSGWVEQGGIFTGQSNRPTIALPVTMSNEHYTVDALIRWDNSGNVANTVRVISATNTSIVFNQTNGTAGATFDFYWQVSGMAA